MKTQRHKIFGCVLLIGAIVVSFGVALPGANADFGKTLTTATMARMFGGGYGCPDKDCDTTSGSCPGGNTCVDNRDISNCYNCKSGNGEACGALQQSWGWMCVDTTEDCKSGTLGSCGASVCGPYTGGPNDGDSCGTRPDC